MDGCVRRSVFSCQHKQAQGSFPSVTWTFVLDSRTSMLGKARSRDWPASLARFSQHSAINGRGAVGCPASPARSRLTYQYFRRISKLPATLTRSRTRSMLLCAIWFFDISKVLISLTSGSQEYSCIQSELQDSKDLEHFTLGKAGYVIRDGYHPSLASKTPSPSISSQDMIRPGWVINSLY